MKRFISNKIWWWRYRRHLKSDKWQKTRLRILRRDGFKCTKCRSRDRLQVHHLTYERVGNEDDDDLITLCDDDHAAVHGKK
ncbi:MAG: hypothetical protein GY796_36470 [Chloroflexi bacterium]|nr:hypothetical protein [Chloroflexota bacterium]